MLMGEVYTLHQFMIAIIVVIEMQFIAMLGSEWIAEHGVANGLKAHFGYKYNPHPNVSMVFSIMTKPKCDG